MYTHIIHLGDIHLRTGNVESSRKIEYEVVFTQLSHQLKKLECVQNHTALIVICGDIFHNKYKLESTTVDLWTTFTTLLMDIAPIVMICGNHDFRQEDPSIQDLISVMVKTQLPRTSSAGHTLRYLDKTGVYIDNNIAFGLVSIKDTLKAFDTSGMVEKLPDFPLPQETQRVKIALFHGTITQSALPNGQCAPTATGYPLEWFKGYDLVLLGDNHLQQVHSSKLGFQWGYPGSLVQQDIGEPLHGHGYILWDLATKKGEPFHVTNPYGRFRCRLDQDSLIAKINGTYQPLQSFISENESDNKEWFPRMPNVTVSGNIGDEVLVGDALNAMGIVPSHISTVLQMARNDPNMTSDNFESSIRKISAINQPSKWLEFVTHIDPETGENECVKGWFRDPSSMMIPMTSDARVSKELKDKLVDRRSRIQGAIDTYQAVSQKIKVKSTVVLKYFTWAWAFSYGDQNWFNFENIEGSIAVLTGPNASGKSSFIDSLCIAIFGEPGKNRNINSARKVTTNFIHHKRPARTLMNTSITLEVNGDLFKIVRSYSPHENKLDDTMAQLRKCELHKIDKETQSRTQICSGATMVDGWVKQNCGEIEDILRTTVVSQFDNQNFFMLKQGDQKDLIDQAVNLEGLKAFAGIIEQTCTSYNNLIETMRAILETMATAYDLPSEAIDLNTEARPIDEGQCQSAPCSIEASLTIELRDLDEQRESLYLQAQRAFQAVKDGTTPISDEILNTLDKPEGADDEASLEIELHEINEIMKGKEIHGDDCDVIGDDDHESKRPMAPTMPDEVIECWWAKNGTVALDLPGLESTLELMKLDARRAKDAYDSWLNMCITPPESHSAMATVPVPVHVSESESMDVKVTKGNYYTLYTSALSDVSSELYKYNTTKDVVEKLKAKIFQASSFLGDGKEGRWEDHQQEWHMLQEESRMHEWPASTECENRARDIRQIIDEIEGHKLAETHLRTSYAQLAKDLELCTASPWKEDLQTWNSCVERIQSSQFTNLEDVEALLSKYRSQIVLRPHHEEVFRQLSDELADKKEKLENLKTPEWEKTWKKWDRKRKYIEKHQWTDAKAIRKALSTIESLIDNRKKLEQEVHEARTELLQFDNVSFNPHCDSCKASPLFLRRQHLITVLLTKQQTLNDIQPLSSLEVEYASNLRAYTYAHNFQTEFPAILAQSLRIKEDTSSLKAKIKVLQESKVSKEYDLSLIPTIAFLEKAIHDLEIDRDTWKHYIDNKERMETLKVAKETESNVLRETLNEVGSHLSQAIVKSNEYDESYSTIYTEYEHWVRATNVQKELEEKTDFIERLQHQWTELNDHKDLLATVSRQCAIDQATLQVATSKLRAIQAIAHDLWKQEGEELQKQLELSVGRVKDTTEVFDACPKMLMEKTALDTYNMWNYRNLQLRRKELIKFLAKIDEHKMNTSWHAWHKYNIVKARIQELTTQLTETKAQHIESSRHASLKSSHAVEIEIYKSLMRGWMTKRDLLATLQARLSDKRGSLDSGTFKEWVYNFHILPLIEDQINGFLSHIDHIRIRIDHYNKNLRFRIRDRGNDTVYSTCSGYQQFILGLAMRQALANIGGAGNNIKHMFIDEGFTACDSVNIEKAHDMMKKLVELGGFRSILIVSHLDVIQESIPLKIKVQRDGSFSKLCFGLKRQAPRQAT